MAKETGSGGSGGSGRIVLITNPAERNAKTWLYNVLLRKVHESEVDKVNHLVHCSNNDTVEDVIKKCVEKGVKFWVFENGVTTQHVVPEKVEKTGVGPFSARDLEILVSQGADLFARLAMTGTAEQYLKDHPELALVIEKW